MKLEKTYKYLLLLLLFFTNQVMKSQNLEIPDVNFKNALLNTACADYNGDGNFTSQVDLNNDDEIQLSEVLAVQGLRVWNQDIVSIEGIENFVNLTSLDVTFNSIETMDISALTNLTELLCYGNGLTELDVSSNENLENLYCNENQITELDVTLNTSLVNLEFYMNNISEIDVTLNLDLETLFCGLNPISELDVTNNLMLKGLSMRNTQISEIDISNNTLLEYIVAENNSISSIDFSQNLNLLSVYLSNNLLTEIDVSNNPNVFELIVQSNNLINANFQNGTAFMTYSGLFGNPDLEFICADNFEIDDIQAELDILGYTETQVSDDCGLSVNEFNIINQINIFPIPFECVLNVKSNVSIENIEIFEIKGQTVLDINPSSFDVIIDTKELNTGFYILRIETAKGVEVRKILKK